MKMEASSSSETLVLQDVTHQGTVISITTAVGTSNLNIRSVPFVTYRHRNDILTDLGVFNDREHKEVSGKLFMYVCVPAALFRER
jgi:hypothetical protein